MGVRWNVKHKDGHWWTLDELSALRIPYGDGYVPADICALDVYGTPMVFSEIGAWCYADEVTDDMEVVWYE